MSPASNKTELSAKVEAELFVEYDAMVPGPAAPSSAGNNGMMAAGGDGTGVERTGRPLKINLDLLSYQAKQKNIQASSKEGCYILLCVRVLYSSAAAGGQTDRHTRGYLFFTFFSFFGLF